MLKAGLRLRRRDLLAAGAAGAAGALAALPGAGLAAAARAAPAPAPAPALATAPPIAPATAPVIAPPIAPAFASAFEFVALGDMPYGPDLIAGPAYRHLIGLVNQLAPPFTVHIGDFKDGLADCGDAE